MIKDRIGFHSVLSLLLIKLNKQVTLLITSFFSDFAYIQIDKERSSSSSTNPLAVNPLNSKIDLHLISPYSITPE